VEPISFSTDDGVRLEGELRVDVAEPIGTATICHPHPLHGGSKDHPLLWAIRNELAHRGFAVLSFNFRGVMGSDGAYGGGRSEVQDARAAVARVRDTAPGVPTVQVGWSFGANVALRESLDDDRVVALALVALPIEPGDLELPPLPDATELRALGDRPVLLLAGERDAFCPPDGLRAYGSGFPNAEVLIVAGTDHYFWRREREAASAVADAASRAVTS
jgi:alpha/beta superfamily hydrolase